MDQFSAGDKVAAEFNSRMPVSEVPSTPSACPGRLYGRRFMYEVGLDVADERRRSEQKYGPFTDERFGELWLLVERAMTKVRAAYYRTEAEARLEALKVVNLAIAALQAPEQKDNRPEKP